MLLGLIRRPCLKCRKNKWFLSKFHRFCKKCSDDNAAISIVAHNERGRQSSSLPHKYITGVKKA